MFPKPSARDRIRTDDTRFRRAVLYPLSYSGNDVSLYTGSRPAHNSCRFGTEPRCRRRRNVDSQVEQGTVAGHGTSCITMHRRSPQSKSTQERRYGTVTEHHQRNHNQREVRTPSNHPFAVQVRATKQILFPSCITVGTQTS